MTLSGSQDHRPMWPRRTALILAVVGAAAAAATGYAALVGSSATGFKAIYTKSNTTAYVASSTTTFATVTAATQAISGSNDLVIARFSAEARCKGPANGACLVRIIAGSELNPISGPEYRFDSVPPSGPDDGSESLMMERSLRGNFFASGPVSVQARVSGAGTTFEIDDWHLTVEHYD